MDAVIEQNKPRVRVAAPATTPCTSVLLNQRKTVTPAELVRSGSRVVVVAPHPDDEVLAIGATLAALARSGHEILVVAVTDGEGSHPESTRWEPETLRACRPQESREALECLGVPADILRLGLPDGAVALHEKRLAEQLPLGSYDTVFVPWRHDGHADHEACARAALAACRIVGARCIEYPVWSLVPSHAAHAKLKRHQLQEVSVGHAFIEAKRRAMTAFVSQVHPDGEAPAVLQPDALDTWRASSEWVIA